MGLETVVAAGPNHQLVLFEGPVFVVRLENVPGGSDVREALRAIEQSPAHTAIHALVWVVTPKVRSYDRSLLEVYKSDGKKPVMPTFMGVVVDHPMHRVVVRAVAVGFRVAMGLTLELCIDEAESIRKARAALEAARRRSGEPAKR